MSSPYPFQSREYQDLFTRHFIPDVTQLVDNCFEVLPLERKAVLIGMKHVLNNQELTDYGDLLGPSKEMVRSHMNILKTKHGVASVQFDYIREDSKLFTILTDLTLSPPIQQEVSPAIMLPDSWDLYLASLERTDRKELKRKIKRLTTVSHEFQVLGSSNTRNNNSYFYDFVKLHKLSDHAKEQFMTPTMEKFFRDLLTLNIPEWEQKLGFLFIEGKPAAAVYYFESANSILLYNSGFDPQQKYYSGGLLLIAELIRKAIENKKKTFDFLRGDERYKYELGGKDCRLYQFTFHLTNSPSF